MAQVEEEGMNIEKPIGLSSPAGLAGETTGDYIPLPKINLICHKCGTVLKPVAHHTGDGWELTLDCECQKVMDAAYFDWPKDFESLNGSDLESMGFELV